MPRHCLTLDLKNDPEKIAAYKNHQQSIWPEVCDSFYASGIRDMEMYLAGNRVIVILDVTEDFSFERKAAMDAGNPRVLEWETLMAGFQDVPEQTDSLRRWTRAERIFDLKLH